jgi:hypothetical protein
MHTRFILPVTEWKWTKSPTPLRLSMRSPTMDKLTNRTLRLSDHNRGHKIEDFNPILTGATISQEVRTTGPTTTTATGRTIRTTTSPISPNPTTPETVNSVPIAKF